MDNITRLVTECEGGGAPAGRWVLELLREEDRTRRLTELSKLDELDERF